MMATATQQQHQYQQQHQHQQQQQHSKEFKTNVMNNDDDNNIVDATTTATTKALADISGLLSTTSASIEKSLATMELQYFKAVSLYRRRNYEKCVEVCNAMLQAGHENNVQMFNTPPDDDEDGAEEGNVNGGAVGGEELNNSYGSSTGTGGGTGVGGSIGSAGISNNSSIQRYSSNLQRMAVRQGGRQRGIYGNNVSNIASSSSSAGATVGNVTNSSATTSSASSFSIMPTWMMEGVWQLKMRALTQRIYIDDLETNDADDAGK